MKAKLLWFVSGVILSFIVMILYSMLSNSYTTTIHYPEINKSYAFMDYLYENDIRFSCEVDPLKRLRITPFIQEEADRKNHANIFNEQYEQNL